MENGNNNNNMKVTSLSVSSLEYLLKCEFMAYNLAVADFSLNSSGFSI